MKLFALLSSPPCYFLFRGYICSHHFSNFMTWCLVNKRGAYLPVPIKGISSHSAVRGSTRESWMHWPETAVPRCHRSLRFWAKSGY